MNTLYQLPLIYNEIHKNQTYDIDFYIDLAKETGGYGVLELGCGTGRITIPLAEKLPMYVTGVDISPEMIATAKAACPNLVEWIEGDFTKIDIPRMYDLIYCPFNSLMHIYSNEDMKDLFRNVDLHLASDGLFAFDILNPRMASLGRSSTENYLSYDGMLEQVFYNHETQVVMVRFFDNHTGEFKFDVSLRCIFPNELALILEINGFEIVNKYGSFAKTEFDKDSLYQIVVCRRKT